MDKAKKAHIHRLLVFWLAPNETPSKEEVDRIIRVTAAEANATEDEVRFILAQLILARLYAS
jgi:hypothetical protein